MKSKFKTVGLLATIALTATALYGCGDDKVSFSTQEQSRMQVLENVEYNAKRWRDDNKPSAKVIVRGDSSISSSCASGDGWASVDLELEGGGKLQLKCSTVSGTIGCMTKSDFQARKQYASQEGTCNNELPFPLPKIVK